MKSQTTLEFAFIVSFVILVAIIFVALYLNYSYNSAKTLHVSAPGFIQKSYPINYTHILLTTNQPIPTNTISITFNFQTASGNVTNSLNYVVLNSSKTQTGDFAYLLNLTSTAQYNPYNSIYTICSLSYIYSGKTYAIISINKC